MPLALLASFCSFAPARPVISGGDASTPPTRKRNRIIRRDGSGHEPALRATGWPSLASGAASGWEFVRNPPRERG
jgi:hypothetical protein